MENITEQNTEEINQKRTDLSEKTKEEERRQE
jgi:hypothetical protein